MVYIYIYVYIIYWNYRALFLYAPSAPFLFSNRVRVSRHTFPDFLGGAAVQTEPQQICGSHWPASILSFKKPLELGNSLGLQSEHRREDKRPGMWGVSSAEAVEKIRAG